MMDMLAGKGFQLLHLNIRSLWPKIDLVTQLLDSYRNVGAFTLSESWLTKDISDSFVEIPNYTPFRLDRNWGEQRGIIKKGGGICSYIRSDFNVSNTKFSHLNVTSRHAEIQWIHITNDHCKDIILVNCYRPPTGDVENFVNNLEEGLAVLDLNRFDIFVLGDMNVDLAQKNSGDVKLISSMLQHFGLLQIIKNPTRYGATKDSILDVIFRQ